LVKKSGVETVFDDSLVKKPGAGTDIVNSFDKNYELELTTLKYQSKD
jgi:hypothetical protein